VIVPLLLLGIGSAFIGYLTKDFFIGLGTNFWGSSILILPNNSNFVEAELLPIFIKWLPFSLSFFGIITASWINLNQFLIFKNFKFLIWISFLINKKWYWEKWSKKNR